MYYVGVMSGTSLDGIDCVLVEFLEDKNKKIKVIETYSEKFEKNLHMELQKLLLNFNINLQKLGEIDNRLGRAYGRAINILIEKSGIDRKKIIAIGCHGQTIFHSPGGRYPFTMQIGDGNVIAAQTNITVVNDFRRLDVAYGGSGAPLTPAFHYHFLNNKINNRAIINLGGISNITILDNLNNNVLGFDIGPANCLMDLWVQKYFNKNYDENGEIAKLGKIHKDFLAEMLNEKYFKLDIPKSTGKELFNMDWILTKLEKYNIIDKADILSTLLELTVITIKNSIEKYFNHCGSIYLCGGGAYNSFLRKRLSQHMKKIEILLTDDIGISALWVEAIAFAWFAKQRIEDKIANLPSVTGANKFTKLGAVYKV